MASGHLYLDEERGQKTFRQLQRGVLREWSFGFLVKQSRPLAHGARELLELDLVELGPTLKGMGDTETLEVRGAQGIEHASSVSMTLTVEELLAPFRARLGVAQQRVARRREVGA
jgi:hypothetical protein